MALTISVGKFKYADNLADSELDTAINTDLATLTMTHVYACEIVYKNGFWHLIILYD